MNKVKMATVTALLAALVAGAACGCVQSGDDGVDVDGGREVLIDCYDPKTGKVVKRDDDCYDDGLTAVKPKVSPLQSAGSVRSAGPVRSSVAPRRTRR